MSRDDPFPEIRLEVKGELPVDSEEDLTRQGFLQEGEERCYEGESFEQFARIGNCRVAEFFAILSSDGGPVESEFSVVMKRCLVQICVLTKFFEDLFLEMRLNQRQRPFFERAESSYRDIEKRSIIRGRCYAWRQSIGEIAAGIRPHRLAFLRFLDDIGINLQKHLFVRIELSSRYLVSPILEVVFDPSRTPEYATQSLQSSNASNFLPFLSEFPSQSKRM